MSHFSLIGFLLTFPFLLSGSEPCIPKNTTQNVAFDRPAVDDPGMPVDAEWLDAPARVMEDDSTSPHDNVGNVSSADPTLVPIENKNGVLSGPNGRQLNKGWEGNCIELYVCWKYKYKITKTRTVASKHGNTTGSETETYCYYEDGEYCWNQRYRDKKVCPCADEK